MPDVVIVAAVRSPIGRALARTRWPGSSRVFRAATGDQGLRSVEASKQALHHAGITIDDVDLVEMNEALTTQVIPSARNLGIDPFGHQLIVHGGDIAVGHPSGTTGARITTTLLTGQRA